MSEWKNAEKKNENNRPEGSPGEQTIDESHEKAKRVWGRVFDGLCVVSGCFFLGIYLPYFLWQGSRGRVADICASLMVFSGVLLPFAFRKLLKKWLKRAYIPLKSVWCGAMCFYMVSFLVFCTVIYGHDDVPHVPSDKQQVVIVFGCQVHQNGRLSAELASRLDKSAELLEEYPEAICIVSGGKGSDEPTSEGWAMKNYLVTEKKIEEKRILTEEASQSTVENLKFSVAELEKAGYKIEECSFICVSSSFHTPRIYLLCGRLGIDDCATASAATPYPFLEFIYTVREYMSYVYLLIFGI